MFLETLYSPWLLYIIITIGILTAFLKPYWAFVLAVFGLSSTLITFANQTETIFGPYLNLTDTFIIIGLLGMFTDAVINRKRLLIPDIVIAVFLIWFISTVQSLWFIGFKYGVLQEIRWALNFPLVVLFTAHFVNTEQSCKTFLLVYILGSCLFSIQHLFLAGYRASITTIGIQGIREQSFMLVPYIYILFALIGVNISSINTRKPVIKVLFWVISGLFLVSLLLSQTRSLWLSFLFTPLLIAIIIRDAGFIRKTLLTILGFVPLVFFLVGLFFTLAKPSFSSDNPLWIVTTRIRETKNHREESRWYAIKKETELWFYESNLLTGLGLGYTEDTRFKKYDNNAFGHVGYVSYLARTGLVGLFIYGVYVPLVGILKARHLYLSIPENAMRLLSFVSLGCFVFHVISFSMNASYLTVVSYFPGLFFGAITGIYENIYGIPKNQTKIQRLAIVKALSKYNLGCKAR
jgi:hypothetical protein